MIHTFLILFFSALNIYIVNFYFINFSKRRKHSILVNIFFYCIVIVCSYCIEKTEKGLVISFLSITYILIYAFILFGGQVYRQLFYGIIYILITLSGNLLRGYISNVNQVMNNGNITDGNAIGYGSEIDELFIKIVLFLSVLCIIHFNKREDINYNNRMFRMFLIFPITTCILLVALFQSDIYQYGISKDSGLLLIALILLVTANIVVQHMFEEYGYLQKEREYAHIQHLSNQMQEKYYKKLEENNQKYRVLLHDMKQSIATVHRMALDNENIELMNYLGEISNHINSTKSVVYSNHNLLNAILAEKWDTIMQKNIECNIYVAKNIQVKNISDFDLIGIVGNMIDNAIDAVEKISQGKERYIKIEGYLSKGNHFFVFNVKNSIQHKPIEENGKFISTKKNRKMNGIGLDSIKSTAEKYGGYMNIEVGNQFFSNSVFLPITDFHTV